MLDDLITKLKIRDEVSAEEIAALEAMVAHVVTYPRHADIVRQGEHQDSSRLLIEGWVARHKLLRDGRRQITQIHMAGDFVDLHSFLLKRLDHTIGALTPCRVGIVPHDRLKAITEQFPHLTRMLWLNTTLDAAMNRQWIAATGKLPARAQVAHLLCELHDRLAIVGRVDKDRFEMPLTQEEIGDTCGMTSVHVSRVMGELRADGLIAVERRHVRILDLGGLKDLAQFDPLYLNLWSEPR